MRELNTTWDIPTEEHYQILYWQNKKINQHRTDMEPKIEIFKNKDEAILRLNQLKNATNSSLFQPTLLKVNPIYNQNL